MKTLDLLTYTLDPIGDDVWDAAGDVAAQCGYDQYEEVLLDYKIVAIRQLSEQSVKDHYAEWLQPPCAFLPNEIVRVDWHTWAVPKGYANACKSGVIARSESIVVGIPTLLAGEVFTYGLGPEYNWLEWGDGTTPAGAPGPSALDELYNLITSEWLDDVCWDAEGNPDYLNDLPSDLSMTLAKALENCGKHS